MAQEEDHHSKTQIVVSTEVPGSDFAESSFVSQNLQTIKQKMTQQMAVVTVAFTFLGTFFLHSIVQPNNLLRRKWWIPFSVFSSVSIIYWYTIEIIIRDYNLVCKEYNAAINRLQQKSSSSGGNAQMLWKENSGFASYLTLYRQNRYMYIVLLSMLAFTSLILYACYSILHDQSP